MMLLSEKCRRIGHRRTLRKLQGTRNPEKSKEDTIMSDLMLDAENEVVNGYDEKENEVGAHLENQKISVEQTKCSYRDSLLGFKGVEFNGVAYGSSFMEEDLLISDLLDQTWKLPEPSEEVKKLMQVYPVMPLSEEEFNEGCEPWRNALIIIVLGARFNFYKLKEMLSRIWQIRDFELIDLPNNYYVVKLTDEENWGVHYKKILFNGPWIVAQHSVLVQRCSLLFDPFHNLLGRITTWVRVPNIPLNCYSKKYMSRLGDMIGKTLKVDLRTLNHWGNGNDRVEKGRYARICVELDLQKRLIPRVIIASAIYNVEYEGLNLICFACGRYGHKKESCTWKNQYSQMENTESQKSMQSSQPAMSPEKTFPAEGEEFGPWMLVKGKGKVRKPMTEGRKPQQGIVTPNSRVSRSMGLKTQNSRYAALADWEEGEKISIGTEMTKDLDEYSGLKEKDQLVLTDIGEKGMQKSGVLHADRGKFKMSQKQVYMVKGKENVDPQDLLRLDVGESSRSEQMGRDLSMRSMDRKKNRMARNNRAHVMVSGSLEKADSVEINEQAVNSRTLVPTLKMIGNVDVNNEDCMNMCKES